MTPRRITGTPAIPDAGEAVAKDESGRTYRGFIEAFPARIGAWSGDTSKPQNHIEKRTNHEGVPVDPLADLIDWLNQNHKTASGKRIVKLIESLRAYETLTEEFSAGVAEWSRQHKGDIIEHKPGKGRYGHLPAELRQKPEQAATAHIEANRLLERYKFMPRVIAVSGRPRWFSFQFYCHYLSGEAPLIRDTVEQHNALAPARAKEWNQRHPSKTGPESFMQSGASPYTVSEGDVAVIVCGIASRGDVLRVRRCDLDDCRRFFYAEPSHKLRCSRECTERREDNDPAFKKHRADYMKKYRRELKQKKQGAARPTSATRGAANAAQL